MAALQYIGPHCALHQPPKHHLPPHSIIIYLLVVMDTARPSSSCDSGTKYHTAEEAIVMLDIIDVASEEEQFSGELDTGAREHKEIVESGDEYGAWYKELLHL